MPRDLPRAVQLLRRSLQVGLETPDPQTLALLAKPDLRQAARLLDATRRAESLKITRSSCNTNFV